MNDVETIRERWADRRWPNIGYFVHGQALADIHALLEVIDRHGISTQPESNERTHSEKNLTN